MVPWREEGVLGSEVHGPGMEAGVPWKKPGREFRVAGGKRVALKWEDEEPGKRLCLPGREVFLPGREVLVPESEVKGAILTFFM